MSAATADKPTAAKTASDWTAIPAPPKVPNFWQGHGYTLHYASPGWDVHSGTHDTKDGLGEPLFHARTAKDAKAWVEQQPAKADGKPAAKPRVRKPKTEPDTDSEGDKP